MGYDHTDEAVKYYKKAVPVYSELIELIKQSAILIRSKQEKLLDMSEDEKQPKRILNR